MILQCDVSRLLGPQLGYETDFDSQQEIPPDNRSVRLLDVGRHSGLTFAQSDEPSREQADRLPASLRHAWKGGLVNT